MLSCIPKMENSFISCDQECQVSVFVCVSLCVLELTQAALKYSFVAFINQDIE